MNESVSCECIQAAGGKVEQISLRKKLVMFAGGPYSLVDYLPSIAQSSRLVDL